MNKISVIIPVKEEVESGFFGKIIDSYKGKNNFELIWVLGPSQDGTQQKLLSLGQTVFKTNSNSRAARLNIGCLLYTSPSPRDQRGSRMPSSA